MKRDELGELAAFLAVGDERSFTRAAARVGTSQSSLSQSVRRLEARLGMRLLSRTTRSVAPTDAGEQLLATVGQAFGAIQERLALLQHYRDRPAGLVRITTSRLAAETVLWSAIDRVLARFPEIEVELSIDGALTNIVTDRFDAGVRLGESVEKDMVALRIGPDLRMAVVGSPGYLAAHPAPRNPRELTGHRCINLRMATRGNLYAWEFEKGGRALSVRVEGPMIANDTDIAVRAAVAGHGLACMVETDQIQAEIAAGRLVKVLEDWCPPFAGLHIYYPERRNHSPAFRAVLDELRSSAK
ncbi:MAG: LysR family transcriptional regulator [Novosphingobium sp.]